MKMEYSVFKVEETPAGLYKYWPCFRRMYSLSLFKIKGIL